MVKDCSKLASALFPAKTMAIAKSSLLDNGSSDNSVRFAMENFPEVKIVALQENKGFTAGNAAGLEVAQGLHHAHQQ
jgi:GT2 family glycosyltransferase